ncbi:MAG: TadE family protein [Anaerolineaceae bacterium]|nr:TadE family protein [Anaerolineaceae bacterium]
MDRQTSLKLVGIQTFPPAKSEKGQSLIELAVSLVFLLILLAGVVDLGRMMFYYIAMRDAAQEGATFGSINPTHCNQIVDRVRANLVDPSRVTVTVLVNNTGCIQSSQTNTNCNNNTIRVVVSDPSFPISMPLLGSFLGRQTINLSTTVNGPVIRPACTSGT